MIQIADTPGLLQRSAYIECKQNVLDMHLYTCRQTVIPDQVLSIVLSIVLALLYIYIYIYCNYIYIMYIYYNYT